MDAIGRALPTPDSLPPGWRVIEGGRGNEGRSPNPRPTKPALPWIPPDVTRPDPDGNSKEEKCRTAAKTWSLAPEDFGHILERHGDPDYERWPGERARGRDNGVFDGPDELVRSYIAQAFAPPNLIGPNNEGNAPCMVIANLGRPIGESDVGLESMTIKVVYELSGRVITAHPI